MYCQKCRTPLKADTSLDNLNPAAFDLLVGSSKSQRRLSSAANYPQERRNLFDHTTQQTHLPIHKRNIPAPRDDGKPKTSQSFQNGGMSFIEITESQIVSEKVEHQVKPAEAQKSSKSAELLSTQLTKHENLFSLLSSHSDIDHPICSECSSILILELNGRLNSATRERDAYALFLKTLQQENTQRGDEAAAKRELEKIQKEEDEAFRQLQQLENEKHDLQAELADLEEERLQLDAEEVAFWKSRNAFDDRLHNLQTELLSLQQKYGHDQRQLERLQKTNVYNDTFCIGHDGYFGTINGLRLGRLPNQNVEWAEINAAWGQTLLLLATIADRLKFVFQSYRLRPLGSTSRIEKLEWLQQRPDQRATDAAHPPPKVTPLDLFSSGDMPLGRMFNHRRFDAGMVAFLDCLAQIGNHLQKTSTGQASPAKNRAGPLLPYLIQGDKIGDVSIRLGAGFSQDENFTKACKYALTCCKFLLAHVSNLENSHS